MKAERRKLDVLVSLSRLSSPGSLVLASTMYCGMSSFLLSAFISWDSGPCQLYCGMSSFLLSAFISWDSGPCQLYCGMSSFLLSAFISWDSGPCQLYCGMSSFLLSDFISWDSGPCQTSYSTLYWQGPYFQEMKAERGKQDILHYTVFARTKIPEDEGRARETRLPTLHCTTDHNSRR